MDAQTGQVLYEKRADAERFPASISKVMTFYLAFEQMAAGRLKPTDIITVSPHAAAQPRTNLGMHAGETITVENALLGMATHSANDMAMAIAEKIGGTEANFATMMNQKARQLGMKNTFFDNPNGLPDPRQVSTAHDIAILCRAIQHNFPQYYGLFDTRSFTYHGRTMRNTNHLLGVVPGVDGIKTGFTNAAGHNIAISGVRDGRRVIVVVLGAPTGPSRDVTARDLLTTGFELAAREDHGVQLAQANVEPPPARKIEAAQVETRAEDPAARPETRHETRAEMRREARAETRRETRAEMRHADSRWTVLVGGFRGRMQAQRFVTLIEHRYRREFRGLQPHVIGRGPFHVQFARLNEHQAKAACETLSGSGHHCSRVSTGA